MRLWRSSFRRGIVPVALMMLVATAAPHPAQAAVTTAAAPTPAAAADQAITLDGQSAGRAFDGIGALSAGASSRLLVDYPEPQRGQILDYLFKPNYGAALQILKVEIGGDTNSTDGAEPSHQRTPTDLDCGRGYEWWLMEQAKARNPKIELSALQWGAPNWTGNWTPAKPTVWTERNIDYLINWLDCAKKRDLRIDYLGGWNEMGYDVAWYKQLRQALDERGYRHIKVVADDGFHWNVVKSMVEDAEFRGSVDAVGQHYVCGYLDQALQCPSPPEAQGLGKALHASEQGSLPYDSGAVPLARAYNRQYIDGAMTSTINWSLIASWYDTMPFQDTGLMGAVEPWSGAYDTGASLWATAHTTQFTRPGWRYLDSAKGYLSDGGSHVTLADPGGSADYSTVIETLDAKAPQQVTFQLKGGLSTAPVQVWSSDLVREAPGRWFVRDGEVMPANGQYTVTLQPGRVYTLSTTTGQGRGRIAGPAPAPMKLPYGETFEHYRDGQTPRYISDLDGAFEAAPCADRSGQCLRQVISAQPVWWFGWLKRPITVVGDLKSWRDYTAGVDARLEQDGWVELLGRVDGQFANALSGIHLRLSSSGDWRLYEENLRGQNTDLCVPSDPSCAQAQGPSAPAPGGKRRQPPPVQQRTLASGRATTIAPDQWHRLGLSFADNRITASLDGRKIAAVDSPVHASGQVGLEVSPWQKAQFDNLSVDPVAPAGPLRYLPAQQLRAAGATSFHHGYEPRKALDGSVQSQWHSEWSPRTLPPQATTIDLGRVQPVGLVTYQPRTDGNLNGVITKYTLEASVDGRNFTRVADGSWALDTARKEISLDGSPARYLRLTGVEGGGDFVSAAEIQVAVRANAAR